MTTLEFLPKNILDSIKNLNLSNVYEIRLRVGFPIKVNVKGEYKYLFENNKKIICEKTDLIEIINNVTENSIYAFNEQIKQGFLTTKNGVRLGLAGNCVVENDKIITIKDFSSINVRVPHSIFGCSDEIYNRIFLKNVFNTLIISSPGMGKTTILKDLVRRIDCEKKLNVLLVDERGEFCDVAYENVDKISYGDKQNAFIFGLRALSPNVVVMDELSTKNDWISSSVAVNNGVKLIATTHAQTLDELLGKNYFIKNIFNRYVFLENGTKKGVVKSILDSDFNEL